MRRTLHASTISVAFFGLYFGWELVRVALLCAVALGALLEFLRVRGLAQMDRLAQWVGVFRKGERSKPSGAFWLLVGFAIAAWVPSPGAHAGIAVAAIADPAASMVGERWGHGKGKSWPGSFAALIAAAGVLGVLPGISFPALIVGAFAAAMIERWSCPLDDNLLLAPGVAWVIWSLENLQL